MMRVAVLLGLILYSSIVFGNEWKTPLLRGEGSLSFDVDKNSKLTVSVSEKGKAKTVKTINEDVADIFAVYSIPSKDCYIVATLEHVGTPCEYNQYLLFFRYDNQNKKIIYSGKIRTFNGCDIAGVDKAKITAIRASQIFLGNESWNRGQGIILYRGSERIELKWDMARSLLYSKMDNDVPVISFGDQKWQLANGEWIEK